MPAMMPSHVRGIDYDVLRSKRSPSPVLSNQLKKQREEIPSHSPKLTPGRSNSLLHEKFKQAQRKRSSFNIEASLVSEPRKVPVRSRSDNLSCVPIERRNGEQARSTKARIYPDRSITFDNGIAPIRSADVPPSIQRQNSGSTEVSNPETGRRWHSRAWDKIRRSRMTFRGWDGLPLHNATRSNKEVVHGTVWIRRKGLFWNWNRCFARIVEPIEFTWSLHGSTRPHSLLLTGVRVIDKGVKVINKKSLHMMELRFRKSSVRYQVAVSTLEEFNKWKKEFERCGEREV